MGINSKQRAQLRAMANGIQPIFQIGKSGLTPQVVNELDAALEARELIKVSVLETCEQSAREVASMASERTHSDVVQTIGRKFVLYRESVDNKRIEL
ncbi:MAG: ribosome assembly RNA-binding protein YhbY [Clostridia bacterium]|nr:ribosome assembly RNA-binding protein YhbY [Clostridia bacterium]